MKLLTIIKETLLTEIGDKFALPRNFSFIRSGVHRSFVAFDIGSNPIIIEFEFIKKFKNTYIVTIGFTNYDFSTTLTGQNKPYTIVSNVAALFVYCMSKYYNEYLSEDFDSIKISSILYQPVFKGSENKSIFKQAFGLNFLSKKPINQRDALYREFIKKISNRFGSEAKFSAPNFGTAMVEVKFTPELEFK